MTDTTDTPLQEIEIDMIADLSCPWSFIARKRLDAVLEMLDIPVRLNWYPYLLAADIPPGGIPRKDWLAKTYGTPEQVEKALEPIRVAGLQDGIEFNFEAIEAQPNTIDAHRLVRFARQAGKAHEMVGRLYELFFIEGKDIGDIDVLADAASELGVMDTFKARKVLESDRETDEVWQEIKEAHELGVKRIPAMIIARKYAILGVEDPVTIAKTLQMVQAEAQLDTN